MAKNAAKQVEEETKEVDLSNLMNDLQARINGQQPGNDAKGEYNALCKEQNKRRGYHKGAMNDLTKLKKFSDAKFADYMRTMETGLQIMKEARGQGDMLDQKKADVVPLNGE